MKVLLLTLLFVSFNLLAGPYDDGVRAKNEGRFRDAITSFKEELKIHPNNSDALLFLGLCQSFTSDLDGAINSFERGLEISPNYHDIRIALGRVLSWKKEYARSEEELQYVIEKAPHLLEAYLTLSNTMLYQKRINDGIEVLIRGSKYDKDGSLQLQKSKFYLIDHNHSEALFVVDDLIKKFPRMSDAHALKGRIIFDNTILDHKEAQASIDTALRIDVNNREALLALGDLSSALWKFSKARTAYQNAGGSEATDRLLRLKQLEETTTRYTLNVGGEITTFQTEESEAFKDLIISLFYRLNPYTTIGITYERALHFGLTDNTVKVMIDRNVLKWLSAHAELTATPNGHFKPTSGVRVGADASLGNGYVLGVDIDSRKYGEKDVLITSGGVTKYIGQANIDLRIYDARSEGDVSHAFRLHTGYDVNDSLSVGAGYSSKLESDEGTFEKGFNISGEAEYKTSDRSALKFSLTRNYEEGKAIETQFNLTYERKF